MMRKISVSLDDDTYLMLRKMWIHQLKRGDVRATASSAARELIRLGWEAMTTEDV